MNKKFTLALTLFLTAGFSINAGDWGLAGSGTPSDPYKISVVEDFLLIAQHISETNTGLGEYFLMTNDIDFGGSESNHVSLPSIGKAAIINVTTVSWGFEGNFDGGNHEIKGIYHTDSANDRAGQFNALFSTLGENGVLRNIVFSEDNFIEAYNYVAPFASLSKGKIENCVNYADVNAVNAFASGICGQMLAGKGVIDNCANHGNINAMTYAAGIIGGTQSGNAVTEYGYRVENCINYGTMTAVNDIGVAGIAGSYSGSIVNCVNYGAILGYINNKATAQYAGGIAAILSYPEKISGCENYADISGKKNVAGIVAMVMKGDNSEVTIYNCKNFGEVTAEGDYVAGIAANSMRGSETEPAVTVSNSYNGGVISSLSGSEYIGNIRGTAAISLGDDNSIEEGLQRYILDGNTVSTEIVDIIDEESSSSIKDGKYMINGKIIIIRDGIYYTSDGRKIRKGIDS